MPSSAVAQPALWVKATTPSTPGKSLCSDSGVKRRATNCDTLAEQFTDEITAT